jgi:Arc/MetJ family transcription regulator
VRNGRPYPDHGLSTRDWAAVPPRQVRLDTLITTKKELALDGLHRALRSALQQRTVIHVRVLDMDAMPAFSSAATAATEPNGPSTAAIPAQPQPPVPNRRA